MSSPKRQTRSTPVPAPPSEMERLLNCMKNEIISKLESKISPLKTCLDTLSSQIKSLESKITSLQDKTEQHDTEIKRINETVENIKSELSSSIIDEVTQRVQRQQNLVISGLPEPTTGSLEERCASDRNRVSEVIGAIGVELDANSFRLTRLGKIGSSGSRLLKIECHQTVSIKNEILRNAKTLRNSLNYKNVYINEDRTPQQQLEWRQIRQIFRERKELGHDVVIYRNKVMLRDEVQVFRRLF